MEKLKLKDIGKQRLYNDSFEGYENVVPWEVLNIKHEQEMDVGRYFTKDSNIKMCI